MSFLTSFCDFPQNEQRSVSSLLLTIVWGTPSFETGRDYLTVEAETSVSLASLLARSSLKRLTHSLQINELLLRRPFDAWGVPATILLTSFRDFPQKEQQRARAFILAIMFELGACDLYSRCAITSSIKPYSFACWADKYRSRSTSSSI